MWLPSQQTLWHFLKGQATRLQWYHRPVDDVVGFWRERWLLPRASRDASYREFDSKSWNSILGLPS